MKRILTAGLLFCCSNVLASATETQSTNYLSFLDNKIFYGAGIGEIFPTAAHDTSVQTGSPGSGWPDDLYSITSTSNNQYYYLTGGFYWERNKRWFPYYNAGLRLLYMRPTTVSGVVDQYSLPEFRNYTYKYDIELLNLLVTAKLDLYRWKQWLPYLTVGAGVSNYFTSDYTEQAQAGVTPRVSPGFQDNSGANFTYSLGAGIEYAIWQNMLVNLEYNYAFFGTIKTGMGADTTTFTGTNYGNQNLKSKLTANAVFLGMTFNT